MLGVWMARQIKNLLLLALRGEDGEREGVKRMKELLDKGRNICVGDQINIPAEVIALVNDGFDASADTIPGRGNSDEQH